MAQKLIARAPKEPLDSSADQNHFRILRKKHQPILQARHNLVHIALKGRENFACVTHLPPKICDFLAYQAILIAFTRSPGLSTLPVSHVVEAAADMLQWPQSQARKQGRQNQ